MAFFAIGPAGSDSRGYGGSPPRKIQTEGRAPWDASVVRCEAWNSKLIA